MIELNLLHDCCGLIGGHCCYFASGTNSLLQQYDSEEVEELSDIAGLCSPQNIHAVFPVLAVARN